jgi:hypothetical protein
MENQKCRQRPGPKPKHPGEKYVPAALVRVHPSELRALKADAKSAGLSLSAFLLECWKKGRC